MAYATKADLQKRITDAKLVQLTDFDNTGEMDDTRITEALNLASATIDSYARARYNLPLVISDQVKDVCVAIAEFKLYEGRQLATEPVKDSFERAMGFLKDVAAGRASLEQSGKTQTSGMDVKTKDHSTSPDVFDANKLDGF